MRYTKVLILLAVFLLSTTHLKAQCIWLTSGNGTDAQAVCVNSPIINITYHLTAEITGASASGLPTGVTGAYSPNLFTISGTPLVTGGFSYTVTTTGICLSGTGTATGKITASDIPAAPTGNALQSFCKIDNPTVADLTATGTGIKWYQSSTGGTALVATASIATGNYYASQTVNGCESTARLQVGVIVNDPLPPTGPSTQSFCTINNPTVANLAAIGSGIKWYTTPTGGTALSPSTAIVERNLLCKPDNQ